MASGDDTAYTPDDPDALPEERLLPDESPTPTWLPLLGIGLALLAVFAWVALRPAGKSTEDLAKAAQARAAASAAPSAVEPAPSAPPGAPGRGAPRLRPGMAPPGAAPPGAARPGAARPGAAPPGAAPPGMPPVRRAPPPTE